VKNSNGKKPLINLNGGEDVVNLLVKCPKCKAIVSTGLLMDLASFCSSILENNKIQCDTCGTMISWSKDDVLATSFCKGSKPKEKTS
jgi:endogenous inhibitor of DNA gyrase (YacG/DUF329 family)